MKPRQALSYCFRLPFRAVRLTRRLLLSLRFWVFVFVALILVLLAYYVVADRLVPFTSDAYVQAYVVQVAAQVEGQVDTVHVHENEEVSAGQLLFVIDPRPFEHKIAQLEAKLALAVQRVAQMGSELVAAKAEIERSGADLAYAQAVYEQELLIFKKGSTTERRYLDALQKQKATLAQRDKAVALARQSEEALAARIGVEHALVAEVRAQLAQARLDLSWTRVTAPANGYITNLQLRSGSYVRVGQPVLTCIDTDQWWLVANFRENSLEQVRPGQPAGVSFNFQPGRIHLGRVQSVGYGVGQGQGVPSGELPQVRNEEAWIRFPQRFQVRIVLDDPAAYPQRVGARAAVTIFTRPDHPLNPVGRWWQQLVAWFDYLA